LFWVTGVLLGLSSVAAEIDRNSLRILAAGKRQYVQH